MRLSAVFKNAGCWDEKRRNAGDNRDWELRAESQKRSSQMQEDGVRSSTSGEAAANDKLAPRYFQIWETYPIQKFTNLVESRWMMELVTPGQNVLLAGSGGGREIEALLNTAGSITALDISPEMLRIGQEKFPEQKIRWRLGDVHSPPLDLGLFDHIFALGGVFAYLKDPFLAAKALGEKLRPGGSLTICVMNSAHPTEKPGRKELGQGRVRQAYSVQEVCQLLEHAGLTVDIIRGFRFLVDSLPAEWNKNAQADKEIEGIMKRALELESELLHKMKAETGKFIWVSGQKEM